MFPRLSPAPLYLALVSALTATASQAADLSWVDPAVASVNSQVISLRHTIHQNPEMGNQEFKTAALVAEQLKSLGLEVRTHVGKTGVVAVLKGALPGPVMALRADMDALPVKEMTGQQSHRYASGQDRAGHARLRP